MRGIGLSAAALPAAATGAVPATVTVKARVTVPPPIDKVYVVVAFGVTLIVPRVETSPIPLSIVPVPASVDHDRTKDSPGLMDDGVAWNETMRGVMAARWPRPPCAPPAAGGCAPGC